MMVGVARATIFNLTSGLIVPQQTREAKRQPGDPVCLDRCGNSRQLHFIEKRLPGERLTGGLVKMSVLQKRTDTSEVFTQERRIRQLVDVLIRYPQIEFPGGDKYRQDCR